MKVTICLEIDEEEYYDLGSEKFLNIIETQLLQQNDIFIDLKEIKLNN